MKILTLNTHSYAEGEIDKSICALADAIKEISPDIVALQEVNQLRTAKGIKDMRLVSWQSGIELKEDNFALCIAKELSNMGCNYNLVWLGIKHGYVVFDEGIAFLCKDGLDSASSVLLSQTDSPDDWKKRMALVIQKDGKTFCNVHMGRWDDTKEPFEKQWLKLKNYLKGKDNVYLMGDFNQISTAKDEGYELILSDGWYDTYLLAKEKDDGYTVATSIDGWKDKEVSDKRIDYIFADTEQSITSSYTIFNGKNRDIISDHYGILVEF